MNSLSRSRFKVMALAGLLIWGVAIVLLARQGVFQTAQPGPPVATAIALLSPPALFLLAYRLFAPVRGLVADLDLAFVVGLQTWRVLGIVFLFLLGLGHLPATFAIPAGVGDVAVGVVALFVLINLLRETPGWQGRVRFLVIIGLLDFAIALTTATLSGLGGPLHLVGAPLPVLMLSLPMILIPAYGVPLFAIFHLIAWLKLRESAAQPVSDLRFA